MRASSHPQRKHETVFFFAFWFIFVPIEFGTTALPKCDKNLLCLEMLARSSSTLSLSSSSPGLGPLESVIKHCKFYLSYLLHASLLDFSLSCCNDEIRIKTVSYTEQKEPIRIKYCTTAILNKPIEYFKYLIE